MLEPVREYRRDRVQRLLSRPPPSTAAIVAAARANMWRAKVAPDAYGPHQPPELRQAFRLDDGCLVGVHGQAGDHGLPVFCSPVLPAVGKAAEQVIYINGMRTRPAAFMDTLRAIADSAEGCVVHGIYNASRGNRRDVARGYRDHIRAERNPALMRLATLIERALLHQTPLHVIAHSQGAAVTAEALRLARNSVAKRFSRPFIETALSRLRIETHGAAGCRFIDGPKYVHYINTEDPVPHAFGLAPGLSLSRIHRPGKGAVFRYFTHVEPSHRSHTMFEHWHQLVHRMRIYAAYREPFTVARARGSSPVGKRELLARLRWTPIRVLVDLTALPISVLNAFRQLVHWLKTPSPAVRVRVPRARLSAGR